MTVGKAETPEAPASQRWDGKERSCSLAEAIALLAYGDDEFAQRYAGIVDRPGPEKLYPPGHEDTFGEALKVLQTETAQAWENARSLLQEGVITGMISGIVDGTRVGKDFWAGHSLHDRKPWLDGLAFWRSELEAVLRSNADEGEKLLLVHAARLPPADVPSIHDAISKIYDAAKKHGCKPPNQKEIGALVHDLLYEQKKFASASRASELAADPRYEGFRGPVGRRVNGSLPAFSLAFCRKSGPEI